MLVADGADSQGDFDADSADSADSADDNSEADADNAIHSYALSRDKYRQCWSPFRSCRHYWKFIMNKLPK
jgi:hypothetical protein